MRIRCILAIYLMTALSRPGSVSGETEYLAVFMEGKKVGHAIQSRVVVSGKVSTTEEVSLTLSRLGMPITVKMTETHIETTDGRPLGFTVTNDLGMMTLNVVGTVKEHGTVELTATSMGTEQKSALEWPSGAVMAEGLRLLQLKKGLKEGLKYTVKVFSPLMQQAVEVDISIGKKKKVDLLGRVVALTEIASDMNLPGEGRVTSTEYVDEDLRMQKSTSPMLGMQVVTVACAKEFALGANDVLELVDKMFLASPEPLGEVRSAESITYHLSPTGDAHELSIPSNDNQIVRHGRNGKVIVTVRPAAAPKRARFPYKGKDKELLEAMQPNRYLQSNHKEIVDLARRAAGRTKDAAKAVRRIEAFAAEYIENKDLSVGYATATEVVASRQGDCSEHAVLTAAMCRAVGIPSQVVVGVAYVEEWAGLASGFGGHAWTQAYVGDRWVGLDAAFKGTGRGGYGPGHIALAAGNGEPADFFNLLSTLGQFKIDKVIVNEGK